MWRGTICTHPKEKLLQIIRMTFVLPSCAKNKTHCLSITQNICSELNQIKRKICDIVMFHICHGNVFLVTAIWYPDTYNYDNAHLNIQTD